MDQKTKDRLLKFIALANNREKFPTNQSLATHLKVNVRTVERTLQKIRRLILDGEDLPPLLDRSAPQTAPMSESEEKFHEDWTPEMCVAELRRIAEENPDRVITRNFFRTNSKISEATWNRFFGTFEEFKRQANVKLTRQQHALERSIAFHASRDRYRSLSVERMGYGNKFDRPTNGKYRTVLVASDLHDIEVDPFFMRVLIDTAKRLQPDVICLNGDVFDLPEFGRYTVDPREWDVVGRIKFVHDSILEPLRDACPDTQMDLIEGNHEGRLLRLLADETPALRTILADLHGWNVQKLFGLDQYEVNYVAKADLSAFLTSDLKRELNKNYKIYWDTLVAHHFPHARSMSMPGWNGHHHNHQVWQHYNPMYGAYEWHQLGAGHKRVASYCEGERWGNGFLIANCNIESKATAMDYVQITEFAVSGGKFYERTEEEGLGNRSVWPG